MNPGKWDYFISYVQRDRPGLSRDIFQSLKDRGKTCWLDRKMKQPDTDAMKEGVKNSNIVLIILSDNYLGSDFCIMELEWAVEFEKPITVVIKLSDKLKIGSFINTCPTSKMGIYKHWS